MMYEINIVNDKDKSKMSKGEVQLVDKSTGGVDYIKLNDLEVSHFEKKDVFFLAKDGIKLTPHKDTSDKYVMLKIWSGWTDCVDGLGSLKQMLRGHI